MESSSIISKSAKERRIRSIITPADHAELQRHYQFVPAADGPRRKEEVDDVEDEEEEEEESPDKSDNTAAAVTTTKASSWQERMVQNYHQHLYKEYVLADMTRAASHLQLGFRWRTKAEVESGKGSKTCGNKHCPSLQQQQQQQSPCHHDATKQEQVESEFKQMYWNSRRRRRRHDESRSTFEQEEMKLIQNIPHGLLQHDFEVPFCYHEQGQSKMELVKLRLCLRCAPLLFVSRGESYPALATWNALRQENNGHSDRNENDSESEASSSSSSSIHSDNNQLSSDEEGTKRRHRKRKSSSSENKKRKKTHQLNGKHKHQKHK